MTVVLYGYWRSLATFRVRAALNLKGVRYTETIVDWRRVSSSAKRSTASTRSTLCRCSSTPGCG